MLLCEIFDDDLNITNDIRQYVMDVLTPLVASHVPFVTVQQVIDELRNMRTGVSIDRGLIMNILDPDKIKIIKKIEGDNIYFNDPEAPIVSTNKDTEEKNKEKVFKTATSQAKKEFAKNR